MTKVPTLKTTRPSKFAKKHVNLRIREISLPNKLLFINFVFILSPLFEGISCH